jgi:hypothetical protein
VSECIQEESEAENEGELILSNKHTGLAPVSLGGGGTDATFIFLNTK